MEHTNYTDYQGRYVQKSCHNGPVLCFHIGGSKVYAGSVWEMNCSDLSFDVFVCAAGEKAQMVPSIKVQDVRGILSATDSEVKARLIPSFLTFEIADGSPPSVGPRFWKALVSDLRDKRLSVGVFCQGGHGRTGTILACLAHYGGLVREKQDVLKFVRSVYCPEAVETSTQIQYLRILGMTTSLEPSWKPATVVPCAYSHHESLTQAGTVAEIMGRNPLPRPDPAVIPKGDLISAEEREGAQEIPDTVTTTQELADWEKEMIAEEHARTHALTTGWNDYAG